MVLFPANMENRISESIYYLIAGQSSYVTVESRMAPYSLAIITPPEPDPVPPPEPDPSPGGGQRIVVDPITRVEGHLRIEVAVNSGQVSRAWSTGTLFRGIETILRGRNPEDAWLFTQRLYGVCTYVHGASSVRCVEDAAGVTIPDNARFIRNLMMGAQYLHDHIVHFYHLHALDWVDMVSALDADPGATAALARQLSPLAPDIDFAVAQQQLASFINGGQLGPFANAYWGHEAYWLNPRDAQQGSSIETIRQKLYPNFVFTQLSFHSQLSPLTSKKHSGESFLWKKNAQF